jgi:hypothetical protein
MADAPTSCKQVFEQMPSRFNKEAGKGLNAVYQFDLSGDGGGKWYVSVNDGQCNVTGEIENCRRHGTRSAAANPFSARISVLDTRSTVHDSESEI